MAKILVIEDEGTLRSDIVMWLKFEGYEALGAVDGMDGVNQALLHEPDLIVCDIHMPRLDGYEVLVEVQANPTTRLTPFIFLTAKATSEDIRLGMALGADDYITKPFERIDLLRAIQARLDKKAAQDAEHERQLEVIHDVLMKEREQRLLQAKLVAMFSHDFRTPLTTILSTNHLLRDYADQLDEARRNAHMERIDASVRRLMQMLDDMLLVAHMESGKFDLQSEHVNLRRFLRDIIADFESIRSTTQRLQFAGQFSGSVMADTRLFRQIAVNLISNAIKYSPRDSEILISLDRDEDQCILIVQDQGRGIPEADLSRLFDDFQRGSNIHDIPGTGLGLAIVKRAIDEYGGTISVESKLGVGTTFTIRLPLNAQPRQEP